MAKAQIRVLASATNTVMVVDDQSTGRAILEQVVRSLDERVAVEGFARPVDAVCGRRATSPISFWSTT